MTLIWQAVETKSGRVLADFPDMDTDSITKTLCKYDTGTLKFPVAGTPAPPSNWFESTGAVDLAVMIVASDAATEALQWGGLITQRTRKLNSLVQLSVATPEYYASRRYIRDTVQYNDVDRLTIAADLLNRYIVDGASGRAGLPLEIVTVGTGQITDAKWLATDDKTVYQAILDLGCEWTFALKRQHNPERITHVCYLSERVGQPAAPGFDPTVTFDLPGNLLSAQIVEDYSNAKGANDIMLTSSGQGSVRPESDHQVAIVAGHPSVEYRASAGSGITSLATLNSLAQQALAHLKSGSTAYALTAAQQAAPLFGDAWSLGDDIGYDLAGPEFPEHPAGVARAIAAKWDKTTIAPVLAVADEETGDDA